MGLRGPTPDKVKTQRMLDLYRQGHTLEEIGRVFNVTKQAVQQRLVSIDGYRYLPRDKSRQLSLEILKLYMEDGFTSGQLAKKYKLSPQEIRRRLLQFPEYRNRKHERNTKFSGRKKSSS